MAKADPRWKARRTGDRYCSPACGRGCTWAEYQDALRKGRALAKRLGTGWRPRVWENVGWHYDARTLDGVMKVHENRSRDGFVISYTAFFERKDLPHTGDVVRGNWTARGGTPQEAVDAVLTIAEEEIATIQESLASYRAATEDKVSGRTGARRKAVRP